MAGWPSGFFLLPASLIVFIYLHLQLALFVIFDVVKVKLELRGKQAVNWVNLTTKRLVLVLFGLYFPCIWHKEGIVFIRQQWIQANRLWQFDNSHCFCLDPLWKKSLNLGQRTLLIGFISTLIDLLYRLVYCFLLVRSYYLKKVPSRIANIVTNLDSIFNG